jgi:hypothetical protein
MSHANCCTRFPVAAARAALALAAVVTLTTLDAKTPANAQGAWCADYSHGGTNCGFYTLQQCREALSGRGGMCRPSPGVTVRDLPPRRKASRRDQ